MDSPGCAPDRAARGCRYAQRSRAGYSSSSTLRSGLSTRLARTPGDRPLDFAMRAMLLRDLPAPEGQRLIAGACVKSLDLNKGG